MRSSLIRCTSCRHHDESYTRHAAHSRITCILGTMIAVLNARHVTDTIARSPLPTSLRLKMQYGCCSTQPHCVRLLLQTTLTSATLERWSVVTRLQQVRVQSVLEGTNGSALDAAARCCLGFLLTCVLLMMSSHPKDPVQLHCRQQYEAPWHGRVCRRPVVDCCRA